MHSITDFSKERVLHIVKEFFVSREKIFCFIYYAEFSCNNILSTGLLCSWVLIHIHIFKNAELFLDLNPSDDTFCKLFLQQQYLLELLLKVVCYFVYLGEQGITHNK